MNYQKDQELDIGRNEAYSLLVEKYPEAAFYKNYMEYYAYPQTFGSTAGPFKGRVAGQAMSTFTIEAWVEGKHAVLFCRGKVVTIVNNWNGPGSVRI